MCVQNFSTIECVVLLFSNVGAQVSSKVSVILFLKQSYCIWTSFVQMNMLHICTTTTCPLTDNDWDCAAWIRLQRWHYSKPAGSMHTLAEPVHSKPQGCNKHTTMHHHHHHHPVQKLIVTNHILLITINSFITSFGITPVMRQIFNLKESCGDIINNNSQLPLLHFYQYVLVPVWNLFNVLLCRANALFTVYCQSSNFHFYLYFWNIHFIYLPSTHPKLGIKTITL